MPIAPCHRRDFSTGSVRRLEACDHASSSWRGHVSHLSHELDKHSWVKMRKLKDQDGERAKTENRQKTKRKDRVEQENYSNSKEVAEISEHHFQYVRNEIVFSQDNDKDVVLIPGQDFNTDVQIQEFERIIYDGEQQGLIEVLSTPIISLAVTSRFVGEEGFRVNQIKGQYFVLIDLVTFREYRPFVASVKLARAIRDQSV